MKHFLALAIALWSCGCTGPVADIEGCLQEEPPELNRECSGDGECGQWLVCLDAHCDLPEAVSGEGGEPLAVVDNSETLAELQVEIALGDLARERGLGHRPCIEKGWGLLIEFPDAGDHVLETNTMRFDLDIAMAGEDRVIHTVHRDAPAGGKALYGASQPTRWVLEVPAGSAELRPGARLQF